MCASEWMSVSETAKVAAIVAARPRPAFECPRVTPDEFIAKWKGVTQTERAASQSHFIDLCQMWEEPTPTDADPTGEWYCFERGASKASGGEGGADVWKRGYFGWENKGKGKDLDAAFVQLKLCPLGLENPPLLIVCDMERFRIVTNWTATVSETHEIALDHLRDATKRRLIRFSGARRIVRAQKMASAAPR